MVKIPCAVLTAIVQKAKLRLICLEKGRNNAEATLEPIVHKSQRH
jgi:hypothetical protein